MIAGGWLVRWGAAWREDFDDELTLRFVKPTTDRLYKVIRLAACSATQLKYYCLPAYVKKMCAMLSLTHATSWSRRKEIEMSGFVLSLLLGAIVAFVGPSLLPQQMRSALADTALRLIGALAIFFAIASTSFVHVPDG